MAERTPRTGRVLANRIAEGWVLGDVHGLVQQLTNR